MSDWGMRNVVLGISLLPYLGLVGADALMHARDRRVPMVEQFAHAGLGICIAIFLYAAFKGLTWVALPALATFVVFLCFDEIGFHQQIDRRERLTHWASWAALTFFVGVWAAL
jgi:hypothetical protein